MASEKSENQDSEVSRLIAMRQAKPDMTVKELAEACGVPFMRAKRLLANVRKAAGSEDVKAPATLCTEFHEALCKVLSQGEEFQAAVHGVFTGTAMSEAFVNDFAERCPLSLPPYEEAPAKLYPLGGCKAMSTVVGMLGSRYTDDAKFEQRKFSSRSLQDGFCDPKEPNSSQHVLKLEVESAKHILRQREDEGVTLTVRLTDIHAQENPREASDPSQKGHFAHVFNIVMSQGAKASSFESRIYSAHIDKDLRQWVTDKYVLVDIDKFVERICQVEDGQTWTKEIDEIWFSLFGVKRPLLCRKKWPIKTNMVVLRSTFDVRSLRASAALFTASNWMPVGLSFHDKMQRMFAKVAEQAALEEEHGR